MNINLADLAAVPLDTVIAEHTSEPISREALARYAEASGDHNPLHLDPAFARQAGFDDVIVHGMLGMAVLGRMLTAHFAPDAIRHFSARFTAVIPVGSPLRCRARLISRQNDQAQLVLDALIGNGDTPVITGNATIALTPTLLT